jgi:hypothetical protein
LGEKNQRMTFAYRKFLLLDKNQRIRGIYNGLDVDARKQYIQDIKILQRIKSKY